MTTIGKDFPVRSDAFRLSSEKRASSAATSPARTECFDIFSPEPGDSDVISQMERLSSKEMKIAARLVWMAVGAAGRSAMAGMVVSRVGGFATSLCQSAGRYPPPHGIYQLRTAFRNCRRRCTRKRRQNPATASTPSTTRSAAQTFWRTPTPSAAPTRSHGEVDSDQRSGRVRLRTLTLETTMPAVADRHDAPTAIQSNLAAIFISLELSRSIWLVTSLSPGSAEKMSKHSVRAGDVAALLARFSELKRKASERTGKSFPIVVIHEAGLDGFWLHRVLQSEGIESHVVDPASIATSRRRRRAKTDRIDGEALLRALLAFKRGEPRVCAMVKAPTPEEEDRRRLGRERKVLIAERVKHVNRVKGLLFSQGVSGYEPLRRDRRQRLDELTTGDGRSLPMHLKTQISRELDRLELLLDQIKRAEAERDALLAAQQAATPASPGKMLLEFRGIGAEFAASLWLEALFRQFGNRRQLASYAGLAPTPWQSGSVDHEQGVSKAGNPRLRTTLVQLAWLWLRHQPQSALALWFKERVNRNGGRLKKTTIVALARKLLVALWKYVTAGVVIEGAVMKDA